MPRLWSTQSTLVVVVAVVFLSLFDSSVNLELLLFFLLSMWTRLALFTQNIRSRPFVVVVIVVVVVVNEEDAPATVDSLKLFLFLVS